VTRKVFLILIALVLALSVGLVACAGPGEEEQLSISDLKGPDWMEYVGTVVTVEGIFVRDPLPMLVTDLDIVKMNMPMLDDQYIILTGDMAENIDPEEYGGAKLKLTGRVVAMNGLDNYGVECVAILPNFWELLYILEVYAPGETTPYFSPVPGIIPTAGIRYAVLFSGGCDQDRNHKSYWNDLTFMYGTLINTYGYNASRIKVLYADGSPGGTSVPMPVDHPATQTYFEQVFNDLRETTTFYDTIFVFTTNHGGGFWKSDYDGKYDRGGQVDTNDDEPDDDVVYESTLDYSLDLNGDGDKTDIVSWDESLGTWGGEILDDDFSDIFADLKYKRMVIVMGQCFSGGLIYDMAGSNRIIMSAAGEYEVSNGYPNWNIFVYHFTCAINGADIYGSTVDADTNDDGKVSMVEAFNYAVSEDRIPKVTPETPYYEDNGDGDPHSGPVPNGGDGTLGSNTFL